MKNEGNSVSFRDIKILVAEDNIVNQKVVSAILKQNGYKFEFALDGNEAISKFKSGSFQLVLMDCQMPNLDGLKASQLIREFEISENRRRIPIVAMTANAMKGDREKCIVAGMDDFLAKPFKSQDLMKVVKQWEEMINHFDGRSHESKNL